MRKQLHYVTLFLLFFTTTSLTAENYVDLYINTYKDIAIREMMRSGIPASITLAQGIHESSWGRGALASNSNNHFGIKCKDYWNGPSFYFEDDDYDRNGKLIKSCFRAYEDPEKSYIDHTDFLMMTSHYQVLFNYSNTDYKQWAKGLKKCGYATDKEYANKLIRTIEKYQLYKYDLQTEQRVLVSAPTYNINIQKQKPTDLLIRSEKKEEVEYTIVNIPPAVRIPDDYQRRPKEVQINYESSAIVQTKEEWPVEEIQYVEREKGGFVNEPIHTITYNQKRSSTFVKQESQDRKMKKESIIPIAFSSTKKAIHLARKPRISDTNLR